MNGPKSKVEATLRDPFGSIRITLWEQYTNQVQEGKTYAFKNLKVRKNGDWHELTTARDGSTTLTEVEPFKETLATPKDIPESFLISKSTAEILGIAQFSVYHSCQLHNIEMFQLAFSLLIYSENIEKRTFDVINHYDDTE